MYRVRFIAEGKAHINITFSSDLCLSSEHAQSTFVWRFLLSPQIVLLYYACSSRRVTMEVEYTHPGHRGFNESGRLWQRTMQEKT